MGDVESGFPKGFALEFHLPYASASRAFEDVIDVGTERSGVCGEVQMFLFSASYVRPCGYFDSFERTNSVFAGELRKLPIDYVVLGGDRERNSVLHAFRYRLRAGGSSIRHRGMEMHVGFRFFEVRDIRGHGMVGDG